MDINSAMKTLSEEKKNNNTETYLRMLNFLNNERNKVSFKRRLQGEEND